MINVIAFDHVVLCCADVATTLAWYRERLGLAAVRVEEWRAGKVPFPSVRVSEDTIIDLVPLRGAPPGHGAAKAVDHICVVIEPTDLAAVAASGAFEVLDGPAARFGARGMATSLYVRDPDGMTVELRYYPA